MYRANSTKSYQQLTTCAKANCTKRLLAAILNIPGLKKKSCFQFPSVVPWGHLFQQSGSLLIAHATSRFLAIYIYFSIVITMKLETITYPELICVNKMGSTICKTNRRV